MTFGIPKEINYQLIKTVLCKKKSIIVIFRSDFGMRPNWNATKRRNEKQRRSEGRLVGTGPSLS
jgi:hypothetical protein